MIYLKGGGWEYWGGMTSGVLFGWLRRGSGYGVKDVHGCRSNWKGESVASGVRVRYVLTR